MGCASQRGTASDAGRWLAPSEGLTEVDTYVTAEEEQLPEFAAQRYKIVLFEIAGQIPPKIPFKQLSCGCQMPFPVQGICVHSEHPIDILTSLPASNGLDQKTDYVLNVPTLS